MVTSGILLWPGSARLRIARELASGFRSQPQYLEAAWEAISEAQPSYLRHVAALGRAAALDVDNAEAGLDRWLGDIPRRRDHLGLFWSLTDTSRFIYLDVSTIAEQVQVLKGDPPPLEFQQAVAAIGAELGQLAASLSGSARLPDEQRELAEALGQVERDVQQLEHTRATELVAGHTQISAAARGVHDLGVIDLTLQRLGDSLRRAEADVRALEPQLR